MKIISSLNNLVLLTGCIVWLIAVQGCNLVDIPLNKSMAGRDSSVSVTIAKWFNNHSAAISITNDDTFGSAAQKEAQKFLIENNMSMDYEVVTSAWDQDMQSTNYFMNNLVPYGFGYYGHGHYHINHDLLSYADDYKDFKTCYDTMKSFGMKPVAYAYPGGFGYHIATQNALRDAGFLSARMFEKLDFLDPFIVPGDQTEPKNWYELPTLIMQSIDYNGCVVCVNNTEDLIPYLDECIKQTAWIILSYHAINNTSAFGYYFLPDMLKDFAAIHQRDFWVSSMNQVTLYVRERAQAKASVSWISSDFNLVDSVKINIDDNLPDDIYYQPLTVIFKLPSYWINNKIDLVENNTVKEQLEFYNNEAIVSLLPTKSAYYLALDK